MTTADMSLVAKESILLEKLKKTCRLNFFVQYCTCRLHRLVPALESRSNYLLPPVASSELQPLIMQHVQVYDALVFFMTDDMIQGRTYRSV